MIYNVDMKEGMRLEIGAIGETLPCLVHRDFFFDTKRRGAIGKGFGFGLWFTKFGLWFTKFGLAGFAGFAGFPGFAGLPPNPANPLTP